jgi:hypothetical protein
MKKTDGARSGPLIKPQATRQKCISLDGCRIENTIRKQWIDVMMASKPCSARGANLRALVGRNRFIAPIGRAPPQTLGSGASCGAERRNKVIAPYGPHFASFNFTNALICVEASSVQLHVGSTSVG